jgi:hypothetical protein
MHDIVIRGGTILDGSGAPLFAGDVAIDGQRLVAVGGKAGPAKRVIDADGLLVTPGNRIGPRASGPHAGGTPALPEPNFLSPHGLGGEGADAAAISATT